MEFREASFYLMRLLGILCLKDPDDKDNDNDDDDDNDNDKDDKDEVVSSPPPRGAPPPLPRFPFNNATPASEPSQETGARSDAKARTKTTQAAPKNMMVVYARALVVATTKAGMDGLVAPLQKALDDAVNAGMPRDCAAAVRARKLIRSLKAAEKINDTPTPTSPCTPTPTPVSTQTLTKLKPESAPVAASAPAPAPSASAPKRKPQKKKKVSLSKKGGKVSQSPKKATPTKSSSPPLTQRNVAKNAKIESGANSAPSPISPPSRPSPLVQIRQKIEDPKPKIIKNNFSKQTQTKKTKGKKFADRTFRFDLAQIQQCRDPIELFRSFSLANHADHVIQLWVQLRRVLSIEKDYSFDRLLHSWD